MLRINNMVPPSAEQWMAVIRGMRLPMKSADKSDSVTTPEKKSFIMGESDYLLALRLTKAGSSDRKFLRQLPIIMEVTADQVFWRQADQYKIGTVTDSSSQMHKLKDTQFTIDDFNIPFTDEEIIKQTIEENILNWINKLIRNSNQCRENGDLKSSKELWELALSLVPQSVLYTKCWSLNYETAINIGLQREGHKNKAWDELINYWKVNLPYYHPFLEAAKFNRKQMKELKEENKRLKMELEGHNISLNNACDKIEKLVKKVEKLEKDNEWLECKWDDERLSSMEDKLGV